MKAAGFMFGEFGDLVLTSTLARTFKTFYPKTDLILCCHKKYSNILPLFYNHEFFDGFHLWQGEIPDDWPAKSGADEKFINSCDFVFTAKPQHPDNFWYKKNIHQIDEIHKMYGFPEPKNKQCILTQWFDLPSGHNKTITASVFASGDHSDQLARTFYLDQIVELFQNIERMGFNIVRLDTKIDPLLEDRWPASKLSFIEATQIMLAGRLHLTCDTSWSWIASSYSHNTLGWTRSNSYVPINPRGDYFVSDKISEISIEQILEKVKQKVL